MNSINYIQDFYLDLPPGEDSVAMQHFTNVAVKPGTHSDLLSSLLLTGLVLALHLEQSLFWCCTNLLSLVVASVLNLILAIVNATEYSLCKVLIIASGNVRQNFPNLLNLMCSKFTSSAKQSF